MDTIWIPSEFMRAALERSGFRGRVTLMPWPLGSPGVREGKEADSNWVKIELKNHGMSKWVAPWFEINRVLGGKLNVFVRLLRPLLLRAWKKRASNLAAIRALRPTLYLMVCPLIPRKGIWLALSEWFSALDEQPENPRALLIKLSSLDMTLFGEEFFYKFERQVQKLARQWKNLTAANIYVCVDRLEAQAMKNLYSVADCYLTASLGEGFGGPVAESLSAGKPVIAPAHSSLEVLLPEDLQNTQFRLRFKTSALTLKDQLPVTRSLPVGV